MSEYTEQAERFLERFGLRFSARCVGDCAPPWATDKRSVYKYRVRLARAGGACVSFSFYGSIADYHAGISEIDAYSVLSCISGDVYCPDTFDEFCNEYGYDTDSRAAEKTFRRCLRFARRLLAFFTDEEIEALAEIQ